MNEEQLKSAVLAKCEELAYKNGKGRLVGDYGHYLSYYSDDETSMLGFFRIADSGNTQLGFNKETYEAWFGWDMVAKILGIKQPEPPRPSDTLLWKCWRAALMETGMDAAIASTAIAWSAFEAWRMNLQPDPLQADRELVAETFDREDLERDLLNECYNYELINAIKRLAGMEVENE